MKFEVKDLCKSFGDNEVLKNVNFSVQSGKALGLLGRNGAGKTTSIRIMMGVFPADSGKVLVDGKPINRNKLQMGYLPEEHGLYPKVKITEQLVYIGELRGISKKDAKTTIDKWMNRLEMNEYSNKLLDTLSKGNQQKIQLVAALVAQPEIVILDEPFSGLDPVNAALLKDIVKELIGEGKIVVFSSHQMSYVEEFCDEIAILNKGDIVISGNIAEIKRTYDRKTIVLKSSEKIKIKSFCTENLGEIVESAKLKRDGLFVELKSENSKNKLMAALAGQNFDIDNFKVFEPSLNDIFVQYTNGEDAKEAV